MHILVEEGIERALVQSFSGFNIETWYEKSRCHYDRFLSAVRYTRKFRNSVTKNEVCDMKKNFTDTIADLQQAYAIQIYSIPSLLKGRRTQHSHSNRTPTITHLSKPPAGMQQVLQSNSKQNTKATLAIWQLKTLKPDYGNTSTTCDSVGSSERLNNTKREDAPPKTYRFTGRGGRFCVLVRW